MPRFSFPVPALCAIACAGTLCAQRGGGDWMTAGSDPQRSSWVRGDGKISIETLRKPGFELVWKTKLNTKAPTPPVLLDFYISYRGFRTLGFVGGASDAVIGIDTDIARIEWEKSIGAGGGASGGTNACPGGMTSGVTRPTSSGYPPNTAGRGAGRGTPAKSGVGEPFEGAVTLKIPPPPPFVPPPAATAANRRIATPPNPFAPRALFANAITSDGKFHSLYVSNGEAPKPAIPFLPANVNAVGLVVFDNTAYVATVNGCGGVEDGIWALDLGTQKVSQWKAGGNIVGSTGFAAGPDGTLYVASAGGKLTVLDAGTLKSLATYSAGSALFTSSPVVFDFKGRNVVAVARGGGAIRFLDGANFISASLGGGHIQDALTSWQDMAGTRWLLAPVGDTVVALKVVEKDGAIAVERGWVSRKMATVPLPPIVINGVVFVLSRTVLYALDGLTGMELWNSGNALGTFTHSGGLSAGGGRVYVGGRDGTLYAFGFPMEH